MTKLKRYEDVYPAVREIVGQMDTNGFESEAALLMRLMNDVSWTSGSELWAELVRFLSDFQDVNKAAMPSTLAEQIEVVVTKMREWFAENSPRGLDDSDDHPERVRRSTRY
jgi:hypothetical protein